MLRIKFNYINLLDLNDENNGVYYFGSEAIDKDGHYWQPRIVDSFTLERFFYIEMNISNRIRTIQVKLDNSDKYFNKFVSNGRSFLNAQMTLYYENGDDVTKTFTGKVNKLESFGSTVELTLREIGYEYLENTFPDAQISYDYYGDNGVNENWNCIPIHFGKVKGVPVSWVNSYYSEFMVSSGPILKIKKIYIDNDDSSTETKDGNEVYKVGENVIYDDSLDNPETGYKANDNAKPIHVRIFRGTGYDKDGYREVVIDDYGSETEQKDSTDNKYHHVSNWGGFAYIQLFSIDDDGNEIPAYPYNKNNALGQLYVDLEGICEYDEETEEYVLVQNPAKIAKMMYTQPELVSEGECAIGWGYSEEQVDFEQAITDCETLKIKIDGSFDTKTQFSEALNQLLKHCRGWVIEENEKITMHVDMPKSDLSAKFDDEGLHGDICDLTEWNEPSLDEQINRVRLKYDWNNKTSRYDKQPSANHQSPDYEKNPTYDVWLEDSVHAQRINKWNPQDIEFKLFKDTTSAHRMAIYYLRKKTKQKITAKITVPNDKADKLDAGDIISVMSNQFGWYHTTVEMVNNGTEENPDYKEVYTVDATKGKTFQISQISKGEDYTEIEIVEYDNSIFLADSQDFSPYVLPDAINNRLLPLPPKLVTVTADYSSGDGDFSAMNAFINGTIEYDPNGSKSYATVQYAEFGQDEPSQSEIENANWITYGMLNEETFRIDYLNTGHWYLVRVFTSNGYGNSKATLSNSILINGDVSVPPIPTLTHLSETGNSIGYNLTGKTVKLRITVDGIDLSGQQVRYFKIYKNGEYLDRVLATFEKYVKTTEPLEYWGKYVGDKIDLVERYNQSYTYSATSVSAWGIESPQSTPITFKTPEEMDLDSVVSTINNIQADQEEMQDRLDDIASDNLITAGEKVSIRKDWASVQSKYSKLHPVIIAEPYDFDETPIKPTFGTDYTAYEAAYTALSNYLNTVILLNVNADVEGEGVVSSLSEKFNDYTNAELKILADVDEANKILAQTVTLECETPANDSNKVIVSSNIRIFDGLRVTIKFIYGNSQINGFYLNFKRNLTDTDNLCGNQLFFRGSIVSQMLLDEGMSLTFAYNAENDRWEATESTQLVWSESPTQAGIFDLTKINGGRLYVNSIQTESIKAGAITSDKITSDEIVGKNFSTNANVGDFNSTTNEYASGVRFDSTGIRAWNTLGKTVEIKNDGSVTLTGSITAKDGYIGGWEITTDGLKSTNGDKTLTLNATDGIKEVNNGTTKFHLTQDGKLSATDVDLIGKITANDGKIGNWDISTDKISANNLILDSTNGLIKSNNFVTGDNGSGWQIKGDGTAEFNGVTVRGTVKANSGIIGGWTIGTNELYNGDLHLDSSGSLKGNYNSTNKTGWSLNSDGTANIGKLTINADGGLTSNQFNIDGTTGNATFTGSMTASSGTIGGWTIGTNELYNGNLHLDSSGSLRGNYVSGIKGWKIDSDGNAEFENALVRGTIKSIVFQYEQVSAIGGQILIRTSSSIKDANGYTLTLDNATNYSVNDIVRVKLSGTSEFYAKVNAVSTTNNTITLNSTMLGGNYPTTGLVGATIVNYGQSGAGGLLLDGGSSTSPKIDLFNHQSAFSNGSLILNSLVRIGNLNGVGGITTNKYGMFIGNKALKQYLQYDPVDGLQIGGSVTVEGGTELSQVKVLDDWAVGETIDGQNVTVINGAWIKANSIAANKLASDAIRSINFEVGSDGFSTKGSFLNLEDGSIITPSFRVDSDGKSYFKNAVSINSDNVYTSSLNVSGNSEFGGHIIPKLNDTYTIGNSSYKWKEAYINEIHGTADDIATTALQKPTGAVLILSAKGCTSESVKEDNGFKDVSGNGNHGILQYLGSTESLNGISLVENDNDLGTCFKFTTDYNTTINIATYDHNTEFLTLFENLNAVTLSVKIKIDNSPTSILYPPFNMPIFIEIMKNGCEISMIALKNDCCPYAYGAITKNEYYIQVESNKTITDGKVHVLTSVLNCSEKKLEFYIDGVLEGTSVVTGAQPPLTLPTPTVVRVGYNLDLIDCKLSDARIYLRALTPNEVKALYMLPDEPLFGQLSTDLIGTGVVKAKNLIKTEAVITETAQIKESIIQKLKVTSNVTLGNMYETLNNTISKLDNLKVGGRNLLTHSKVNYTTTSSTNKFMFTLYFGEIAPYTGATVTITMKIPSINWDAYSNGTNILINLNHNSFYVYIFKGDLIQDNIYKKTFVYNGNKTSIGFQLNCKQSTDITIEWIKLEFGEVPSTWTPAPEDIELKMPSGEMLSWNADSYVTGNVLDEVEKYNADLVNVNNAILDYDNEQGYYLKIRQNTTLNTMQYLYYDYQTANKNPELRNTVTNFDNTGYSLWIRCKLLRSLYITNDGEYSVGVFSLKSYTTYGIRIIFNSKKIELDPYYAAVQPIILSDYNTPFFEWVDLCMTAEGINSETKKLMFYVNGIPVYNGQHNVTSMVNYELNYINIARGGGSYNSGYIDMDFKAAKVFPRPLTDEEVLGLTKCYVPVTRQIATLTNKVSNINIISEDKIRAMFNHSSTSSNEPFDYTPTFKRYGFIITHQTSLTNPNDMVQYIYDAVGMTPAGLNSSNQFNYGSWETFCNDICKPFMVAPDGTLLYELDHNDQTKKIDGTNAPYDDYNQTGNMMAVFKKLYISITEPTANTLKVVFSDAKLDDTYHSFAFTDENGLTQKYVAFSMFNGTKDSNNRLRSLKSTTQAICNTPGTTIRQYAKNNGSDWDFPNYSLWNHIQCLLILISKSLDVKTKFGNGNISGGQNNPNMPGTLISTGMFSGTVANETSPVKTFYIENMWGECWNWVNGLVGYKGDYYVKLTPPYVNSDLTGYTNVGVKPASGSYGTIQAMGNYNGVLLPKTVSGQDYSKYYKAMFYNGLTNTDAVVRTALFGGRRADGAACSVFSLELDNQLSISLLSISGRLALQRFP